MTLPAITTFSSSLWTAIEAPLANHLWQSTFFAAAAGVLTLAFKKNRAQVRYWLWLAASVKFLVPFSLLVSAGSYLGWSKAAVSSEFSFVMKEIGQPFASTTSHAAASSLLANFIAFTPALLLVAWAAGCLAVVIFWWVRWRRITYSIRGSLPIKSGGELEALRRLEQSAGIKKQIELIVSESALEPGIVGIFRPILVLPAGIADRLSDAQMEAIITHELCHVRRRDNLISALHMLVEALFWFHPLVWWIGARMVDERERACDEEVLIQGSDPQVYAEGILKVCEFYLESPLVCAAGVTGSNLKKRIEAIMVHRMASKLNLVKKLLLTAVAGATFALPVVFGLLHPASGRAHTQGAPADFQFESVSIKAKGVPAPTAVVSSRILQKNGQTEFVNQSLKELLEFAYRLNDADVSGGAEWLGSDLYDLETKMKTPMSDEQYRADLQKLLAERFKLVVHRELKELPVYELRVGEGGAKLNAAHSAKPNQMIIKPVAHLEANGATMASLVEFLESRTGRKVLDKTGLNGTYDFTFDGSAATMAAAHSAEGTASLAAALSEQLGLELNTKTAPVETLVIDHAEEIRDEK
ncbi:MAG TPA: M56 family metallopeptidase [Candidatus Angelobacter sp.]